MMHFLSDYAGIIGLLFFVFLFTLIMVWAFRPSTKEKIESYKHIPLTEEFHDLK